MKYRKCYAIDISCIIKKKNATFVTFLLAEDTGLTLLAPQPAVLRLHSRFGLDPSLLGCPPDSLASRSGPFGFESRLYLNSTKEKHARIRTCFFWRRTRDSNPRGCYTLLAFQASSLATRSILHSCPSVSQIGPLGALNNLPYNAGLCK